MPKLSMCMVVELESKKKQKIRVNIKKKEKKSGEWIQVHAKFTIIPLLCYPCNDY